MKHYQIDFRTGRGGLMTRVATAIVAAVFLVATFFLGLFVIAVFAGIALILSVAIGTRLWWARRTLAKQMHKPSGDTQRRGPQSHDVFDGEFHEVREHDPRR